MSKAADEVAASAREALMELAQVRGQLEGLIEALPGLPLTAADVGKRGARAAAHAAGLLRICAAVAAQAANLAVVSGVQTVVGMMGDALVGSGSGKKGAG